MTTSYAETLFHTPRTEGEVDLIALVRGHLKEHFTEETIVEIFDSHPLIASCAASNSTVQKTNLCRFWTQQLMGIPNSQSARLSLIPAGNINLWYKLFSEQVLPFCVVNGAFRKVH